MSLKLVKQDISNLTSDQQATLDSLKERLEYELPLAEQQALFEYAEDYGLRYSPNGEPKGEEKRAAVLKNNAKFEGLYKILHISGVDGLNNIANPTASNQWIARETTINAVRELNSPQHELYCRYKVSFIDNYFDLASYRSIGSYVCSTVNAALKLASVMPSRVDHPRSPGLKRLTPLEVSTLITMLHDVILISPGRENHDESRNLLAIYDNDPRSPRYGLYRTEASVIKRIARAFEPDLTQRDVEEVYDRLRDLAETHVRGSNRDLVPVNNGIFDYSTKELMDFDPQYIFTAKSPINFNPDAKNPLIKNPEDGTEWDVHSWIEDLFFTEITSGMSQAERDAIKRENDANKGLDKLVWQIIGAILRPYVSWNKAAFFYAVTGNNGKGTLVELMRNLVGTDASASIPLADFGKDFALEPLMSCNAILVDENDVGVYLDRAAELRAVITNDVVSINRKFQAPISYRFYGFMVQCLNDLPKLRDKSESLYRRQLFVPFNKSFTGVERKYIKDDYIKRREVLEYIMKYVLVDMEDYYSFDEPEASKNALGEFKHDNDPVRDFWDEFEGQFQWSLLPLDFLYGLYKAWLLVNAPMTKPLQKRQFGRELRTIVKGDFTWEEGTHSRSTRMDAPEPLLEEYNIEGWSNTSAGRSQRARYPVPSVLKNQYKGYKRL